MAPMYLRLAAASALISRFAVAMLMMVRTYITSPRLCFSGRLCSEAFKGGTREGVRWRRLAWWCSSACPGSHSLCSSRSPARCLAAPRAPLWHTCVAVIRVVATISGDGELHVETGVKMQRRISLNGPSDAPSQRQVPLREGGDDDRAAMRMGGGSLVTFSRRSVGDVDQVMEGADSIGFLGSSSLAAGAAHPGRLGLPLGVSDEDAGQDAVARQALCLDEQRHVIASSFPAVPFSFLISFLPPLILA
jgi:hypothetical protein